MLVAGGQRSVQAPDDTQTRSEPDVQYRQQVAERCGVACRHWQRGAKPEQELEQFLGVPLVGPREATTGTDPKKPQRDGPALRPDLPPSPDYRGVSHRGTSPSTPNGSSPFRKSSA